MSLVGGDVGIGNDGADRAFGHADGTVDTAVGINDQKIGTFDETIHRAHVYTVCVFAFDARLGDDKRHGTVPSLSFALPSRMPPSILALIKSMVPCANRVSGRCADVAMTNRLGRVGETIAAARR